MPSIVRNALNLFLSKAFIAIFKRFFILMINTFYYSSSIGMLASISMASILSLTSTSL